MRAALVAAAIVFASVTTASAAEPIPDALRDPWLPPAVRQHAQPLPETRGDALRAQVERKLRQHFDAADASRSGRITKEQARAAHWGFVTEHFDEIDTAREGRVSFEDVKRFLRARGARSL